MKQKTFCVGEDLFEDLGSGWLFVYQTVRSFRNMKNTRITNEGTIPIRTLL